MMRNLLFFLLFVPTAAIGQIRDSIHNPDVLRAANAMIHTYISPLKWKGQQWMEFGAIMGSTAAMTFADQPVRQFWTNQNSRFLDGVSDVGYHYGKPYCAFLFSGALYSVGLIAKNQWLRETGLILGTTLMATGLLEMGLKPLVGRARPPTESGNYDVTFFNSEPAYHSFPSGHASMAFAVSFVMAKRTKSLPVKIFFYSLATTTAVCRLYSDVHWVSDVAFGGVIAWYCSEAVLKRLQQNRLRNPRRKTKWNVTPYAGGISLKGTFQ